MSNVSYKGQPISFQPGDPVIMLYQGRHNGMWGRFVGLRADPNWADIEERNGSVQSHPVRWLRHLEDLPMLLPCQTGGVSPSGLDVKELVAVP